MLAGRATPIVLVVREPEINVFCIVLVQVIKIVRCGFVPTEMVVRSTRLPVRVYR